MPPLLALSLRPQLQPDGATRVQAQAPAVPAAQASASRAASSVAVGPGPVAKAVSVRGYRFELRLAPNRASTAGTIVVLLRKDGRPVDGARVRVTFSSLEMAMGSLSGVLPQTAAGRYGRPGPVLGMDGRWRLRFEVAPKGAPRFSLTVVDRVGA